MRGSDNCLSGWLWHKHELKVSLGKYCGQRSPVRAARPQDFGCSLLWSAHPGLPEEHRTLSMTKTTLRSGSFRYPMAAWCWPVVIIPYPMISRVCSENPFCFSSVFIPCCEKTIEGSPIFTNREETGKVGVGLEMKLMWSVKGFCHTGQCLSWSQIKCYFSEMSSWTSLPEVDIPSTHPRGDTVR